MKKAFAVALVLICFATLTFADTIIAPTIGFSHISGRNLKSKEIVPSYNVFDSAKIAWAPMTVGLGIGSIKKSGFLFMWENYISFIGKCNYDVKINTGKIESLLGASSGTVKINDITSSEKMTGGFFYETNLMFGYSFRPIEKIHINLALGLGFGFGKFNFKFKDITALMDSTNIDTKFKNSKLVAIGGVPIELEFQYYFTKSVGLNIGIFDTIGYGAVILFPEVNATYSASGVTKNKKQMALILGTGIMNNFTFKVGPVFKISK
ncbi:MAG: hypothetical protein CR988_06955 [Treponema sp.]|nr:MAG: hypothetical protein CR988_06955 [Treponema sp.]